MKSKKLLVLSGYVCLLVVLVSSLLITACSKTTSTTAKVEAQPTAPSEPAETPTLKIGYVGWLENFIGLDTFHAIEVSIDLINQQGGLAVGGKKYNLQLIDYDSNNNQATMTAAVNRLIFEDNVKFIVSDGFGIDAVIPITEANKVILCTADQSPVILNPSNHYSFMVGFQNTGTSEILGWFATNFPDKKNVVIALPDNQLGHIGEVVSAPVYKAFNVKVDYEYYPADVADLSSLGTKVKTLNPDVFGCSMGSAVQPFAAVRRAGYKGQLFSPSAALSVNDLLSLMSAEELEGFIGPATPTEFEPALTEIAKTFKAGWIAKFGKWEGPEITMVANFDCLITALQKAGSLDTEAVAAVIGNGLQFETPSGPAKMISRPDLGNNRTIDSVQTAYMKKIVGGKGTLLATISMDEGIGYFQKNLQANPPPK
jgi:branched-chain amino acid transport system substrate-binding protein